METNFRFSTKKEYEDEMKKLISRIQKSKKRDNSIEEQYEELIEEYLKFCSAGEDA